MDRVRTLRGGTPQASRAWQAGDLLLLGLYLYLRQNPDGQIPDQTEDPSRPHASEAQEDKSGNVEAHAPPDPRPGKVAAPCRPGLLQLLRRANQCQGTGRVPASCHRPVAAHVATSQPKGSDDVGTDDQVGGRLASETDYPSSLAKRSLCRHTPEVGAACGKAARTALCGGRGVTRVPTARCASQSWCDPAGESPAQVRGSVRLVASVA